MQKKPNILFISVDSLRADHMSLYGYKKETTPNLCRLAEKSVVFDHAISAAAWTGASVSSMLTGLYPVSHGFTNARYYLDDDIPTVAERLSAVGYSTAIFSNNLYITDKTGLTRGFDDYYYKGVVQSGPGNRAGKKSRLSVPLSLSQRMIIKDILDFYRPINGLQRDDGAYATNKSIRHHILNHGDKPFFIFVHYQEPHSIYFPPLPYRRRYFSGSWFSQYQYLDFDHIGFFAGRKQFSQNEINAYTELYDGEIAYLDYRLGQLFDWLADSKTLDDTLIIFTADHGESMGENGYLWHAFCIYNGLIRVPLMIRYPEWFPKAQNNSDLIQNVDLVPTICEGLNIPWDYKNERQGQSFLKGSTRESALCQYDNPERMVDRWLARRKDIDKNEFKQFFRSLTSIQTHKEKLIHSSDHRHEFFNLEQDPSESVNRYSDDKERALEMEKRLDEWLGSLKPHVANSQQEDFDKETWEKMKALGYA